MATLPCADSTLLLEPAARPRLGLLTRGLQQARTLPALLPDWNLVHGPRAAPLDAVLAWGRKPSAEVAEWHAQRHGLPLLRAEDGFLRSIELGHREPPLSIVVDDLGLYYDVAVPSRLERLIAGPCSGEQRERARRLRDAWVAARVSKYNHVREGDLGALTGDHAPVLVVDQTAGDASIGGSGADAGDFRVMLEAALDEHPQARIWLKVHPDVVAGRKRGHFDAPLPPGAAARVTVIAGDVHVPALLDRCVAVYVVSSQVGFEALLWRRPVRCFGLPFYAGWGLTADRCVAPARRAAVDLDTLVHAALVAYPRYLDPETGALCSPERLLVHLALQRRMRARFAPRIDAIGFSRWKRPIARAFFGGSELRFVRAAEAVDAPRAAAAWGRRPLPAPHGDAARIRVEDGFLRSVGLGADLTQPLSWVQDDLGIYFDASRPSRLEVLLQTHEFDAALLQRAKALADAVVAARITKYNVGRTRWTRSAGDRPVVLVPGQVEGDASIAWGAVGIRTNAELLRAVRAACPDAWLLYKPHPDVLAGLRDSARGAARAQDECRAACDELVGDADMGELLDAVDAVHTLTSLTGFEALLRGRPVTTWGLPFYAGWGLTDDRAPATSPALQRRTRRLSLDQLVAGTLILYPTYVSRTSGAFTTPERALRELLAWRADGAARPDPSTWRLLKRRALRWFAQWRDA